MKKPSVRFTFDPGRRGLQKLLGDLEAAVMEIVWRRGEVTVRDVYEDLSRKRRLAYTTVMTVMSRLASKHVLSQRRDGAAFIYSAPLTREEFTRSAVKFIVDELLADFAAPTVNHFVEAVSENAETLDELENLVKQVRKTRERRRR